MAVLLAACPFRFRPGEPLVEMDVRRLPALTDDLEVASLRTAIERTLPVYAKEGRAGAAEAAMRLLAALDRSADPNERRDALAGAFRALRVRDPLLVTAYYEPEIAISPKAGGAFRHPIYRRPPDLVDVDPTALDPSCACTKTAARLGDDGRLARFPSRGEIDAGALAGRRLELAWTDDPLALFFLHVQGSGRGRLPDGRLVGIRFAGTNGLPFRALSSVLIEHGLLTKDDASMFAIRRVFADLPETTQRELMAENPRYVFFAMARGDRDPVGSLGVELTPGRSIATDPALIPAGSLGYLVTPTVRRFVVAQDTGAAIRGAHVDLFAGAGAAAEQFAGRQKERGTFYVLVPAS